MTVKSLGSRKQWSRRIGELRSRRTTRSAGHALDHFLLVGVRDEREHVGVDERVALVVVGQNELALPPVSIIVASQSSLPLLCSLIVSSPCVL